jgi:hypothetical protein
MTADAEETHHFEEESQAALLLVVFLAGIPGSGAVDAVSPRFAADLHYN